MGFLRCAALLFTVAVLISESEQSSQTTNILARKIRDLKPTMAKLLRSVKSSQVSKRGAPALRCFNCESASGETSCVGSEVTCLPGQICASVWHVDNTNFDGCMAPTLCHMLQTSVVSSARCCNTDMCNSKY